jgi:hypothetical protein
MEAADERDVLGGQLHVHEAAGVAHAAGEPAQPRLVAVAALAAGRVADRDARGNPLRDCVGWAKLRRVEHADFYTGAITLSPIFLLTTALVLRPAISSQMDRRIRRIQIAIVLLPAYFAMLMSLIALATDRDEEGWRIAVFC